MGEFPDLDNTILARVFNLIYDIVVHLRQHVRDCAKRKDEKGEERYRGRIKALGLAILKACGLSVNDIL